MSRVPIKCDFVFTGDCIEPDEDVHLVVTSDEYYVEITLGDKQVLMDSCEARSLIFQLHRAVMDHLEARKE